MLTLKAYAKINLGLRIIRKREDEYHEIETVFHRVDVFDEITLSPSSTIKLSCDTPELSDNENNLCVRAAELLLKKYIISAGVHIELKKNIPIGAGLGGGSSDAAATLRSLNQMWKLSLNSKELELLALQLGSDVPYFLHEGSAYATGRGEKLEYFTLNLPYSIVLVYPNILISTAWAYQNTHIPPARLSRQVGTGGRPTSHISLKQLLTENINDARRFMTLLQNDFEPLVLRTHPQVAQVKKALYDLGAEFAQMSGSGSSVYGLFADEEDANHAADKMKKNCQTFITPPHFMAE